MRKRRQRTMQMGATSNHGEGVRVFAGLFSLIPLAIGVLILSAVWGVFDGQPTRQEMRVMLNGQSVTIRPNPGMKELVKEEFKDRLIPNLPDSSHEFLGGLSMGSKLFFSLIAGGFVLFGIAGIVTAAKAKPIQRSLGQNRSSKTSEPLVSQGGYTCGKCGAALTPGADVSPSGDVKCTYCNGWFNIHRS